MKQLLFDQGSGGGGLASGTVLWENPNPTSAFNETAITLSDDYTNYDYIGCVWKAEQAQGTNEYETIWTKLTVENSLGKGTTSAAAIETSIRMTIGSSATTTNYNRCIKVSETENNKMTIEYAYSTNGSRSSSRVIPLRIIGY